MRIDLNVDIGEGYEEKAIMPYVSSASIACTGHTGDTSSMRASLLLAAQYGVSVGAHPSYPDREGFGRKRMQLSPEEITSTVQQQIKALQDTARAEGIHISHVKPHGMLYNVAAGEIEVARAVAKAIASTNISRCYGLAGSYMIQAAKEYDLQIAAEAFADRRYTLQGFLLPRSAQGAVLAHKEAISQGVCIAQHGSITCSSGEKINIAADSICIHGDTPSADIMARDLHAKLTEAGLKISAPC